MDVERGPGWLFIRLHAPDARGRGAVQLADPIWAVLRQHLACRLVLELDEVPSLSSSLLDQLLLLHRRIRIRGGLMRLCGLSEEAQEVLRISDLESQFPAYPTREDAVMARLDRPAVAAGS
jgi:anti-anti-sigma factor